MEHYVPGTRISKDVATCLFTHPHDTHWWAYTSECGGHMAEIDKPHWYDDHRIWLCPGNEERK